MTVKVKERRIVTATHIRQLLAEQINILRNDEELDNIDRARAIAYLSNVSLTAIKEGDLEERIALLEDNLRLRNKAMELEIAPNENQDDKLKNFSATLERTFKEKGTESDES